MGSANVRIVFSHALICFHIQAFGNIMAVSELTKPVRHRFII